MPKAEAITLETLTNDPRFQGIQDEAVKAELLNKFARKYPEAVKNIAAPVASEVPVPTATPVPSSPSPTPLPETDEWRSGIARPGGVMGALRNARQPGGMLSNESLGTAAAGMLVPGGPLAGGLLRSAATKLAMRGGAGALGAMAGRATELTGQEPGGITQQLLEAGGRGALAEGGGGAINDTLGALGRRVLRPRGPLSPEQHAAMADRQAAELLPKVSAIRGSGRAALLENIPRTVPGKSKTADAYLKAEKAAEQKALLDMAERVSPGASRDFEVVGATMQKGRTVNRPIVKEASDNLYQAYADTMETANPKAVYSATKLTRSAADVIGTESPLSPFQSSALPKAHGILNQFGEPAGVKLAPGRTHGPVSQSVAEQLSLAGYDPAKVYTAPELLRLTQRLGKAAATQKDPTARAELTIMWQAAADDLADAAQTAGVPEARLLLEQANKFYKENIIELFDHPKVIRMITKLDPSKAADILFRPSTSVEHLRRMRKVTGADFEKIQAAWIKDVVERRAQTPTGEFDAGIFVREIAGKEGYSDAQLKELTGQSYGEFKTFLRALQRQEANTVGGEKYSLANAQMGTMAAAVGALLYGRPGTALGFAATALMPAELISRVMYTDRGIRWLTVGLGSSPGSKKFIEATSALARIASEGAALYSTRPIPEGESGLNVQRLTGLSAP